MATTKTYLGAVKPVGSKIVFSYSPTADKVTSAFADFDFKLVDNYIVTGLSLTKTGAGIAAAASQMLAATVLGVESDGTEQAIACAAFVSPAVTPVFGAMAAGVLPPASGGGLLGEKAIAGVPSFNVAVGTLSASPIWGVPTGVAPIVRSGISSDAPLYPYQTIPAPGVNYQTLRLRITWNGTISSETDMNARCLVEIDVAKSTLASAYAGVAGEGNGQGSEVVSFTSAS